MKASEKKTVRWTVFRERVTLHYGDTHAAASEVGGFGIIKVCYPHQKQPDFIGLFAVLWHKKCWQTRKVYS